MQLLLRFAKEGCKASLEAAEALKGLVEAEAGKRTVPKKAKARR